MQTWRVFAEPVTYIYVTRSDKIGLIAKKYTCSVYGVYHLICRCYLKLLFVLFNSLGFSAYIRSKNLIMMLCIEK